jgi:hypothetical protein
MKPVAVLVVQNPVAVAVAKIDAQHAAAMWQLSSSATPACAAKLHDSAAGMHTPAR